jgi:hypothetical protein
LRKEICRRRIHTTMMMRVKKLTRMDEEDEEPAVIREPDEC